MPEPSWRWRFQSPGDRRRRRARFRPSERGEDGDGDDDEGAVNNLARNNSSIGASAARFLLGPRSSSPLRSTPSATTSASPLPRHRQRGQEQGGGAASNNPAPFLTMALLRLEQIFPDFCLPLAQASHDNISKACAVMDSGLTSMTTAANNPSRSPSNSSGGGSPRSPRSPQMGFLHWLPDPSPKRTTSSTRGSTRSLSPPTVASSAAAMALEGEWDSLSQGFLVLCAAEYLYQDMQQLKRGHSLRGLYEYVLIELTQVHNTLCEPFLSIPTACTASRENKYVSAARSVAQTLQCFLTLCQARIQLIDVQSNLFTVGNLDEVKEAMSTLLAVTSTSLQVAQSTNNSDDHVGTTSTTTTAATTTTIPISTAANPVKESLIQELKLWKHLLEACVGLQRCEFFSTLMGLRRFQTHLQIPARTRIEKWFDESCRILISLLPIYFDRVAAFAKPLYGFEPVLPAPSTTSPFAKNWEAKVTEFLRKQEKGGGPPTAVAVVLDALGADNLHVQRGYQGRREEVKETDSRDLPERVLWPAVYLRSTLHLDHTPSHHRPRSPSGRDRHGSSSKFLSDWGSSQASSSEQSSSRIFGSSSIRNLDIDPHVIKPKNHILEYGPEGHATSWPHNDWAALVSLLEISPVSEEGASDDVLLADGAKESFRMAEELVAVTYGHDEEVPAELPENKWKPSLERAVRIFGVYANSDTNALVDAHAVREHGKQRSTFHIVSLSKYLSMVVMVKDKEDSHFLRRRNPLSDEEIRRFMNDMAAHWNITRRFSPESLPRALSTARIELLHEEWDTPKILDLVHKIKSTFGLRAASFPLGEGPRGISFLGMNSPKKVQRRLREPPTMEDTHAAAIFFLGPELANLFDI